LDCLRKDFSLGNFAEENSKQVTYQSSIPVPILWQGGYTNRGAGKMVSIRYTFRTEQEKVPPKGVFVVIAYEEIYT
jgi:hypothetical protein